MACELLKLFLKKCPPLRGLFQSRMLGLWFLCLVQIGRFGHGRRCLAQAVLGPRRLRWRAGCGPVLIHHGVQARDPGALNLQTLNGAAQEVLVDRKPLFDRFQVLDTPVEFLEIQGGRHRRIHVGGPHRLHPGKPLAHVGKGLSRALCARGPAAGHLEAFLGHGWFCKTC